MQLSWNIFGQASPSRYMHMNCQNWHNFAADDGDGFGFSGGGDPVEQGGPRLAARGHQGGLPDALQVDFCLALHIFPFFPQAYMENFEKCANKF